VYKALGKYGNGSIMKWNIENLMKKKEENPPSKC
jgi:choline kinase